MASAAVPLEPPSRPLSLSQSNPSTTLSTSTPTPPFSPAARVWNTAEIRLHILQGVDRWDLVSLLRVEKRGMALVAGKVYHEVTLQRAWSTMSVSSSRQRMYEEAITDIDATGLSFTSSFVRQFQLDSLARRSPSYGTDAGAGTVLKFFSWRRSCLRDEEESRHFETYGSNVVDLLAILRERYTGLRTVYLGRKRN